MIGTISKIETYTSFTNQGSTFDRWRSFNLANFALDFNCCFGNFHLKLNFFLIIIWREKIENEKKRTQNGCFYLVKNPPGIVTLIKITWWNFVLKFQSIIIIVTFLVMPRTVIFLWMCSSCHLLILMGCLEDGKTQREINCFNWLVLINNKKRKKNENLN